MRRKTKKIVLYYYDEVAIHDHLMLIFLYFFKYDVENVFVVEINSFREPINFLK